MPPFTPVTLPQGYSVGCCIRINEWCDENASASANHCTVCSLRSPVIYLTMRCHEVNTVESKALLYIQNQTAVRSEPALPTPDRTRSTVAASQSLIN